MIKWKALRGLIHLLARTCPSDKYRVIFYRLRGTKIGDGVWISDDVYLEQSNPELITIEEGVHIGPGVIIVTHDSSWIALHPGQDGEPFTAPVTLRKHSFIGAGAIILPGVTIGEYSVIGAGSIVTKDIPPTPPHTGYPRRHRIKFFALVSLVGLLGHPRFSFP